MSSLVDSVTLQKATQSGNNEKYLCVFECNSLQRYWSAQREKALRLLLLLFPSEARTAFWFMMSQQHLIWPNASGKNMYVNHIFWHGFATFAPFKMLKSQSISYLSSFGGTFFPSGLREWEVMASIEFVGLFYILTKTKAPKSFNIKQCVYLLQHKVQLQ